MNGQIQAMCQRLPSIGRGGGGSAKEKKGLLLEIVETFSLSLAHERYDVRYLFYGIFYFSSPVERKKMDNLNAQKKS